MCWRVSKPNSSVSEQTHSLYNGATITLVKQILPSWINVNAIPQVKVPTGTIEFSMGPTKNSWKFFQHNANIMS